MVELIVAALFAGVCYVIGYEQGEADGINKQNKYWPERHDDEL